jgi:ubiquinone biosynthesis protein COQ9
VLARSLPRDPATVAATLPQAHRSFALMLREAGIEVSGLRGRLRVAALLGLWLAVQRVWLHDDGADNAATMAALDRHLERLFSWSPLFHTI